MAHTSSNRRSDIAGIQYLRGIAALMVVIFHESYQLSRLYARPQIETLASGVDIFFVISGFVMIYSTHGGSRFSPGIFFLHRLARIAPLYWAATAATIFAIVFAPGLVKTAQLSFTHAALSLLFIAAPNPVGAHISPLVTVGWTLNLEMFFYVVFALAIAIGRRSPPRVTGYVLVALGVLAVAGLVLREPGVTGFYLNPILLEFTFGIGFGWIYLHKSWRWPHKAAWLGLKLGLMSALVLILLLPPPPDTALRCFRYGIPALMLVAIATYAEFPRWRFLHRMGDISYSLYISHFFTLSAVSQVWRRFAADDGVMEIAIFYVVGTVCAVSVGYICWRWIEKPLTMIARRRIPVTGG